MLDEVGQPHRQARVQRAAADLAVPTPEPVPKLFTICNKNGRRPPLVLLPGLYGLPFPVWTLPSVLGKEQPVYMAHAFFRGGSDTQEQSIEGMAAAYCSELKGLCPGNRIVVAGYSFGVLPAFEIACRLPAQGIEVPLLISLDGGAPGYPKFLHGAARLLAHWNELAHGDRGQYLVDRIANARRRLYRLVGREYELTIDVRSVSASVRNAYKLAFDVNIKALKRYRPTYSCVADLLLLRAERAERWVGIERVDPHLGWDDFIRGRTSVVTLPGDHGTITDIINHPRIAAEISQHLHALAAITSAHVTDA